MTGDGGGRIDRRALLVRWVASGLDPATFGTFTLPDTLAILEGAQERLLRDQELVIYGAWLGAILTAYPPREPRKFVKLETLLGRSNTARRKTPEEMKATLRAIFARRRTEAVNNTAGAARKAQI